jgi:Protein of unknown function (DUF3037)
MPSFYSVLQYAPNPISGEVVNFGVVTFGDGGVHCRFVDDWRRVRNFSSGKDIGFLQRLVREVQAGVGEQPTLPIEEGFTVDEVQIRRWAGNWLSNLRVTSPRASMLDSQVLLEDIYRDFVHEPRVRRRSRTRRWATAFAAEALERAIGDEVGPMATHFVQKYKPVQGALDMHQYDLIVKNGQLYFGAQALSFESTYENELAESVRLAAWDISDVANHSPQVPLAVVALPPKRRSDAYDLAHHLIGGLGATFLTADQFPDWAHDLVRRLPLQRAVPPALV